jgi:hypothetical protein
MGQFMSPTEFNRSYRLGGQKMAYGRRSRSMYRRARRTFRSRRYKRGGFGAAFNMKYVAGVGIGYFAPTIHPLQDVIITTMAVLPIRLPYNLKMVAQGYVLGKIVKGFIPSIGGIGTTSNGGDFV